MTALKKLCIHQNHIQKDIGFLNKTKMQNVNGELRTAFFEWLMAIVPPEYQVFFFNYHQHWIKAAKSSTKKNH